MLDLAWSLAPIPFFNVHILSSPHTDDAHRARVAHEVAAVHGLSGLLTLWACQEFFPATERNEGEMTPPRGGGSLRAILFPNVFAKCSHPFLLLPPSKR